MNYEEKKILEMLDQYEIYTLTHKDDSLFWVNKFEKDIRGLLKRRDKKWGRLIDKSDLHCGACDWCCAGEGKECESRTEVKQKMGLIK